MPTNQHVDKPLTNISVAYLQSADGFVADKVFPKLPVMKQSDLFFTYEKGHFFRDDMKVRADATESAGSDYEVNANGTYFCSVKALHKDLGDQERANFDEPLSADTDSVEYLSQKVLINKENQWVSNYFTTGVWGTDLTPTNKWSDYTNGTPLSDIRTGISTILSNTGMFANTLVLGWEVYQQLIDHPDITDRVKYIQTNRNVSTVDKPELAALFGIDRVLVTYGVQNTAAEGATDAISFIGGKHAMLCYSEMNPGLRKASAGYTMTWKGYAGNNEGVGVNKFRMPHLKADRYEVEVAQSMQLMASDLGFFFNAAVA